MFFTNRKLIKKTAIVVSVILVAAMLLGTLAPYLM